MIRERRLLLSFQRHGSHSQPFLVLAVRASQFYEPSTSPPFRRCARPVSLPKISHNCLNSAIIYASQLPSCHITSGFESAQDQPVTLGAQGRRDRCSTRQPHGCSRSHWPRAVTGIRSCLSHSPCFSHEALTSTHSYDEDTREVSSCCAADERMIDALPDVAWGSNVALPLCFCAVSSTTRERRAGHTFQSVEPVNSRAYLPRGVTSLRCLAGFPSRKAARRRSFV